MFQTVNRDFSANYGSRTPWNCEHGLRLPFRVRDQFETIGQQGLDHESHLVFRRIPLSPRLNVKPIVGVI